MTRRTTLTAVVAWGALVALAQWATGCASITCHDVTYSTFGKDVAAEGELTKPDGTKVKLRFTSNVNAEALRAVAEGAAAGAVRGVKP